MKLRKITLSFLSLGLLATVAGCSTDGNKIKELEDKIAELESKVAAKDQEIASKDSTISEKDAIIASKNEEIGNKDSTISVNAETLITKEETISTLTKEKEALEAIKNSNAVEIASKNLEIERCNKRIELAKENKYEIIVTDIDGEVLSDKTFTVAADKQLTANLQANYEKLVISPGYYGNSLDSIDGSIIDPNYYLAIDENYTYAEAGIDGLTADAGDIFEFTSTCWNTKESGSGTMDDTDILVDKIIYHYAKNKMQDSIANATKFEDSTYWENLAIYLMNTEGYDPSIFNLEKASAEYKASITGADVSSFASKPANFAKYYWANRLVNPTDTYESFKTSYGNYLESLTTYGSEYTMPFALSPAKALELDSKIVDSVKNPTKRAGVSWGPDGLAWELTGLALYNTLEKTELDSLTIESIDNSYSKDVSAALCLLPFAAMNVNPRTNFSGDKDLINILLTYYDLETKQFDTEKLGSGDYSSNQIYASLMAYKVSRDNSKAVNLFA